MIIIKKENGNNDNNKIHNGNNIGNNGRSNQLVDPKNCKIIMVVLIK